MSFDTLPSLRKLPGPLSERPSLASTLRTADEQTLLGMLAVLRARDTEELRDQSFVEWGVVAASRSLGRLGAATVIERFRQQGVPGMSPLTIPAMSLHSASGTISIFLGSHGPNFGVGSGSGHLGEGLLAAVATIRDDTCPGVWLVMTECDPEPIPDVRGLATTVGEGYGVALALVPENRATALCLRKRPQGTSTAVPSLSSLSNFLANEQTRMTAVWRCPLPGGGEMELLDRAIAGLVADEEAPRRRLLAG
jgi:hypothetical protein